MSQYVEDLAPLLNDRVQQSKTRAEAEAALNERGPVLIAAVADLNGIVFSAERPRRATMVRAILDDRFGKI
jgi:hypothetical protein